jgi:hypothetical protein
MQRDARVTLAWAATVYSSLYLAAVYLLAFSDSWWSDGAARTLERLARGPSHASPGEWIAFLLAAAPTLFLPWAKGVASAARLARWLLIANGSIYLGLLLTVIIGLLPAHLGPPSITLRGVLVVGGFLVVPVLCFLGAHGLARSAAA